MTISSLSEITSMEAFPWDAFGLKIGLEIHRQLKGHKLFCRCPIGLFEQVTGYVERRLIPRGSELGNVDGAARSEWKKGTSVIYELTPNTCPVDIDEEPPHPPDRDLVENALLFCIMFGCDPVDRIQFMRKIVIDGSNPSGFQRTALLGLNGTVKMQEGSRVPILSICLEEDAGRRIPESTDISRYRLDRAGTPEIEISTGPDIKGPREAISVAKRIGDLLKSTGNVRRGIGSVRQDVNISVLNGPRVEVKLVQDLPTIAKVVRFETIRHLLLIEVSHELSNRGIDPSDIDPGIVDLTYLFKGTSCTVISSAILRGESVLGIAMKGFSGLMGERVQMLHMKEDPRAKDPVPGLDDIRRLGPEFAGYVKAATGLKGLFHSDELPGYGISDNEVSLIRAELSLTSIMDGFVIICSNMIKAGSALGSVISRARLACTGIVPEVRRALPDGRTEYMRPISGAARMYPETDIPPIAVSDEVLEELMDRIPEDPLIRIERLATEYGISKDSIVQIDNADLLDRLETLVISGIDPRILSNLLLKGHEVLGPDLDDVPDRTVIFIIRRMVEGCIPRESVPELLKNILDLVRSGKDIDVIEKEMDMKMASSSTYLSELKETIEVLIADKKDFILKKGSSSVGPLMGSLMKIYHGRIDGAKIENELRKRIDILLEER